MDDLANATAYLGAMVRKAGVTVAISTDGEAPALAGLLREALEVLLPDDLDTWMALRAGRPARLAGATACRWPSGGRCCSQALNQLYERQRAREPDRVRRTADR